MNHSIHNWPGGERVAVLVLGRCEGMHRGVHTIALSGQNNERGGGAFLSTEQSIFTRHHVPHLILPSLSHLSCVPVRDDHYVASTNDIVAPVVGHKTVCGWSDSQPTQKKNKTQMLNTILLCTSTEPSPRHMGVPKPKEGRKTRRTSCIKTQML